MCLIITFVLFNSKLNGLFITYFFFFRIGGLVRRGRKVHGCGDVVEAIKVFIMIIIKVAVLRVVSHFLRLLLIQISAHMDMLALNLLSLNEELI